MRGRRDVLEGLTCAVLVLALGGCATARHGASQTRRGRPREVVSRRVPTTRAFLSLVPACGCARHTELDLFSTVTGKLTYSLQAIHLAPVADVDAPALQAHRGLLITVSTGFRCAAHGTYAECPHIKPNSCTNEVLRIVPGAAPPVVAFTLPGRYEINDAIPSPDGRAIVLARSPCTTRNGLTDLIVRSSPAGHNWALFGRRNACDEIERPAWNQTGSQVVFVYDRARSAPDGGPASGVRGCPTSRNEIVTTAVAASRRHIRRIADEKGCAYAAAAFDSRGVLAVEGCKQGGPRNVFGTNLGDGYLVQFDPAGHRLQRWRLKRGVEHALISAEPATKRLLITQDLPANNHEPEADWVWELDGSHLRLIDHYRAQDAAQVLAVGW